MNTPLLLPRPPLAAAAYPGGCADLRPQLNAAYDMTETITPNIDKLAKSATVFHRAYCQQAVRRPVALPSLPPPPPPHCALLARWHHTCWLRGRRQRPHVGWRWRAQVCSPSRNSFMSGRRREPFPLPHSPPAPACIAPPRASSPRCERALTRAACAADTTKVWNFINVTSPTLDPRTPTPPHLPSYVNPSAPTTAALPRGGDRPEVDLAAAMVQDARLRDAGLRQVVPPGPPAER